MNKPLIPIRVAGVPEHFNLPWILALERRAFIRAGVELKWSTVPEGTGRMCAMLRSREIDMAVMVTEGAVRDILLGNPSRIVSSFVDSPLTWGVHVGAGSGITTVDQLKGVPVAVSRLNSGSHLAALAYAHAKGWSIDASGIEVVNDLAGARERLSSGAPAVFHWERSTTQALVDEGIFRRVDEHSAPWPAFVLVATEAVLAKHSKEADRILKVIRDQAAGLMQKKTAAEIIAQRYRMKLEDAQEWFAKVRWNTEEQIEPGTLGTVMQLLFDIGMLDQLVPADVLERTLR